MESQLRVLVDEFAQNPATAGKAMRDLLESRALEFTKHALELLKTVPMGPGSNYILTLLLRDPTILQKLDPRFDARIVKQMTSTASRADQLEPATAERLLDLMSAFSDSSRTLPVLAELLKHPSPRIRSKAVLLMGRARGDAKLPNSHVREKDARVRANAIEALWGDTSPEARSILTAATTDPDNRAVANAAIGLYKLDDTHSIALVLDMSEHSSPVFRCSAVWVMSETEDPRFLKTLAKLIGDADPRVRNLAFHAVAKIRKNKALLMAGPKLKVFATEVDGSKKTERKLRVSVCMDDGKPAPRILGVQFALDETKRLVAEYSVHETAQTEILAVGIAMPGALDQTNEFMQSCEQSLQANLQQKRAKDQWAVLKYSSEQSVQALENAGAGAAVAVKFSTDPTAISGAVGAEEQKDGAASGLAAAAQGLLSEIACERGQGHLLLIENPLAAHASPDEAVAASLLTFAKSSGVQIHSLVLAASDAPVNPHLRRLCEGSGGRMVRVAAASEVAIALEVLLGALSSSYEITYVSNSAAPTNRLSIQVYSPQGCGEQTFETHSSAPTDTSTSLFPTLPELPAHSSAPDPA
jgi:HEAT repeat protein